MHSGTQLRTPTPTLQQGASARHKGSTRRRHTTSEPHVVQTPNNHKIERRRKARQKLLSVATVPIGAHKTQPDHPQQQTHHQSQRHRNTYEAQLLINRPDTASSGHGRTNRGRRQAQPHQPRAETGHDRASSGHSEHSSRRRQDPTGHQAGVTSTACGTDGQNRPAEHSSRREQQAGAPPPTGTPSSPTTTR